MSGETRPASAWPTATWIVVSILALVGAVAIGSGILSTAVVLDLLALWPVAAPAIPLGIVALVRRRGGRLPAAAPLVLVTWLVVTIVLHIGGWTRLPSTAAAWAVPAANDTTASVSIVSEHGTLRLGAGTGRAAVTIDPTRRGGDTAPPAGAFRRQGSTLDVVVEERADPGWLGFSGWEVRLAPGALWAITVAAPEMSLDVSGLRISGLDVQGSGIVVLGDEPAAVTVSGDLTLVLPVGAAAVLTGSAHVPADWTATDDGWVSPGTEPATAASETTGSESPEAVWVIAAHGRSVRVETR